jgi:regulator of sirC expression with transglutaminase-like and TPR domain
MAYTSVRRITEEPVADNDQDNGGKDKGDALRKGTRAANADAPVAALGRIAAQPDDAIDIAEAALILASFDHPATDLDIYRDHLQEIAGAVADKAGRLTDADGAGPDELAGVLSDVLAGHFRYAGDEETYDDLDNANLMRVIERRKGLPVALGILYLAAARAQGWVAAGLNFPGHFLIRIESRDGRRAIVDPFHAGRVLETPALRELLKVVAGQAVELEASHYKTVSNRDILIRLQNNVKSRRLDLGLVEDALGALTRMQILSPDQPLLWREAGLMQMRLGRMKNAIDAFEGFILRAPDGPERRKIVQVVRDLRERLH